MTNWEGYGKKRSSPNQDTDCPTIRLDGMLETMKTLCQESRRTGLDSNPAPPGYESKASQRR
jgi:hypothetical protein